MTIKNFAEDLAVVVSTRGTLRAIRRIPMLVLAAALAFSTVGCAGGGGGGSGSTVGGTDGGGNEGPGNAPPAPSVASVTLAWSAPALSSDGTSLTDLAGYRLYDGSTAAEYTMVTDVGKVTAYTTEPLPAGTYYFAVTAYDTSGNESEVSNEVIATVTASSEIQVLASSR